MLKTRFHDLESWSLFVLVLVESYEFLIRMIHESSLSYIELNFPVDHRNYRDRSLLALKAQCALSSQSQVLDNSVALFIDGGPGRYRSQRSFWLFLLCEVLAHDVPVGPIVASFGEFLKSLPCRAHRT
ncbi:hypothetical protein Tco_0482132 [Tanacetum coccineum]